MSLDASKWAWSQQVGNPTRKLVLMALADHTNGDGWCYPTMKKVAELAECDRRTVERHIDRLEQMGLVRRLQRRVGYHGHYSGWDYQLQLHATPMSDGPCDTSVEPTDRPSDTDDGSTMRQQRRVDHTTPVSGQEPSGVEPSGVEPSGSCSSPRKRDELWEAVLATCQWQQSELTKSARGAANRAVKDLRDVGASPDDIAPRAAEYRRRWPNMSLTPTALAKNWAELGSPAPAGGNGNALKGQQAHETYTALAEHLRHWEAAQ